MLNTTQNTYNIYLYKEPGTLQNLVSLSLPFILEHLYFLKHLYVMWHFIITVVL